MTIAYKKSQISLVFFTIAPCSESGHFVPICDAGCQT